MSAPLEAPGAAPRWRLALLLARRDAARHHARTALVLVTVVVAAIPTVYVTVLLARVLLLTSSVAMTGSGVPPKPVTHYVDPGAVATTATAAALAVVLLVVLVAAAHLIGLRRRLGELAVLEATGATRADLRRVVVAPAALVATVGAAAGSVVAVVVAFVAIRPADVLDGAAAVVAAAVTGGFTVAVAVGAAWVPARQLLGAAPGWRGPSSARVRATVRWSAAVATTAVGATLATWAASTGRPLGVVLGAPLAHVGLVALLGLALGGLGRLPARGFVARYVLRDAARSVSRTLAAVASSATVVAGVTAALVYTWSTHGEQADWAGLERTAGMSVVVDTRDGTMRLVPGPTTLVEPLSDAALVTGAVLAALLVTWVLTALAAQESGTDLGTLDAVGAGRGTRRRITAAQCGLVGLLAAGTGVPGGLALGALLVTAYRNAPTAGGPTMHDLAAPLLPVAALLIVLPLVVAAAGAALPPGGGRRGDAADART